MRLHEIVSSKGIWDTGIKGQSHYFKIPCSWNSPCFMGPLGVLYQIKWSGEIEIAVINYHDLISDEWYFCNRDGDAIDIGEDKIDGEDQE